MNRVRRSMRAGMSGASSGMGRRAWWPPASVAGVGGTVAARSSNPRGMSVQARNWRLVQADSVFIGVVNASGTFLPVFLLRLGASAGAIGLLTALPAPTAFALAIPVRRWLQRRRDTV